MKYVGWYLGISLLVYILFSGAFFMPYSYVPESPFCCSTPEFDAWAAFKLLPILALLWPLYVLLAIGFVYLVAVSANWVAKIERQKKSGKI